MISAACDGEYMSFDFLRGMGLPRAYRNPLTSLARRYGSDKGLTTRGHGYTRAYHHFFNPIRMQARSLLEIGLQRPRRPAARLTDAPSLRMWREYFPNAVLVGFDIRKFACHIPNCIIVCGDQGNAADLELAAAAFPEGYDIVIDDGSHASPDQQLSFAVLFPRVKPGGFYIIEDLHSQPPEREQPDVEKTATVFRRFAATGQLSGRFFSHTKLVDDIETIYLLDSLDTDNPVYSADALLIVRKKTATGATALSEAYRAYDARRHGRGRSVQPPDQIIAV
jgi:hypothetical protein